MSFGRLGGMGRGFGRLGSPAPVTSPLRGDAFVSFASMQDGAPTTMATGQPIFRQPASAGIVEATVSSGALVAAASGEATTAAYTAVSLPEEVKSFYTDVSFGDANDAAGLIVANSIGAIGQSSMHIIFTNAGWSLEYYSSTSNVIVETGAYTAISSGVKKRIGWRVSGNDFYFLKPDGTEAGPITSEAVATRNNQCAIIEHYRTTTGASGTKFYGFAVNLFASPTAAGRTNLAADRNNLASASWTKSMTGPTSGQTDAEGGTLGELLNELAASQNQFFYQGPIAKAGSPIRYTWRGKVKLVGRTWAYLEATDGAVANILINYYDLGNAALGSAASAGASPFSEGSYLICSLGNGWYELKMDFISNSDTGLLFAIGVATGDNEGVYAGDITKGMNAYDQWLYSRPT